jgi:type IV secretion system protein VirB9
MKPMTRWILSTLLLVATASGVCAQDLDEAWKHVRFGSSTPTLQCHPLAGCLVLLEAGETVSAYFLLDPINWDIDQTTAGPGAATLFAIKPLHCGFLTNLSIATDRRVYSLLLQSFCTSESTPTATDVRSDRIRFSYPQSGFAVHVPSSLAAPAAPVSPGSAAPLPELHFDYDVSRQFRGPHVSQVYDDGARTYVVLPRSTPELPGVFTRNPKGELELVNFTAPAPGRRTLVVDRVADEIVLLSGPGRSQKTVIRRETR